MFALKRVAKVVVLSEKAKESWQLSVGSRQRLKTAI